MPVAIRAVSVLLRLPLLVFLGLPAGAAQSPVYVAFHAVPIQVIGQGSSNAARRQSAFLPAIDDLAMRHLFAAWFRLCDAIWRGLDGLFAIGWSRGPSSCSSGFAGCSGRLPPLLRPYQKADENESGVDSPTRG